MDSILSLYQQGEEAVAKGELAYALSLVELAQVKISHLNSLPT